MKRMNKIVLGLLAVAFCMSLSAQNKKKFNPDEFLPQAGDFSVSISANPLTDFLGTMFNGTTFNPYHEFGGQPYMSNSNTWNNIMPLISVTGKYLVTDHLAIRANLGWMHTSDVNRFYAPDDAARLLDPLSEKDVIDTYTHKISGGSFAVAAEYRIGNRRVQGIVGGGLMYAFNRETHNFAYGNAMTEINQNPSSGIDPALSNVNPVKPGFASQRYLSSFTNQPTHYFGPYAFIGVEWFFAPWVSLGGEVNIAAAWNWRRGTYYKSEGFNTISGEVENWTELVNPSSRGFDFGTGNIGANITISFYFNRGESEDRSNYVTE